MYHFMILLIVIYPLFGIQLKIMDDSSYRLNFDPDRIGRTKSITTARKSILKLVKLQSLVAKYCKNAENIVVQISRILYTFVLRAEICTNFEPKVVQTYARNRKVYKICEI